MPRHPMRIVLPELLQCWMKLGQMLSPCREAFASRPDAKSKTSRNTCRRRGYDYRIGETRKLRGAIYGNVVLAASRAGNPGL